jgi:phage terminase large subunit-like protein
VLGGRIKAGEYVRLACKRHRADRKRKDLAWSLDKALDAIDFFSEMLVLEGGTPFKLQPFQQFIVGSIFGWYMKDGRRRFRTAYIEIGKGNGKTPMAAGVGLYGLVGCGEPAPEVYAAAVSRDQAKICFKDAVRMRDESPELADLIQKHVTGLTIPKDHATFRPVSSEHRGLDGLRVFVGLIDEVHEHPSAMVVDKIRAGTKARRDALIFEITNSGYDRNSVCWAHHELSVKVLQGVVKNDQWFGYVCTLDDGDDWRDERVWHKANPGLGTILPKSYLREQVTEAKGMPSKQNIVRRLNFCEWTEQANRWLDMPVWDENAGTVPAGRMRAALEGGTAWVGLDLGSTSDLTALVLVVPDDDGGCDVLPFFWCPEEGLRRRSEREGVPYAQWAEEGWIETTPGEVTDYDFIEKRVLELAEQFRIKEVAFDRWHASQLVTHLQDEFGEGDDTPTMVQFGQGFASMAAPVKELERLIVARKLRHGGHPVLRWMASNVAVQQDPAGNLKIDKARSSEKVDGMVALAMAIGRATVRTDDSSIYASRHEAGEEIIDAW